MKKQKIISIALTLIFAISLFNFAAMNTYADSRLTDKEIFDLKGFGIVEGDENNELNLENDITRAEFTKVVVKLTNVDVNSYSGSGTSFLDVPKDHWAYKYIILAQDIGYVNGDGYGHFYPENKITFNEAVKVLVTVLGSGLDNTVFEVQRDNPPPVYIWNSARKNVTIGTADDFLINQKHVVIIKESTGKLLVRAIVIII